VVVDAAPDRLPAGRHQGVRGSPPQPTSSRRSRSSNATGSRCSIATKITC